MLKGCGNKYPIKPMTKQEFRLYRLHEAYDKHTLEPTKYRHPMHSLRDYCLHKCSCGYWYEYRAGRPYDQIFAGSIVSYLIAYPDLVPQLKKYFIDFGRVLENNNREGIGEKGWEQAICLTKKANNIEFVKGQMKI